jgi:hypothetical protein
MAYNQAIADEVCERIAQGETLRAICREEGKPSHATIYNWLDENADFALRFAHARELGEELIAQECLSIADTPMFGVERTIKPDGSVEEKQSDMLGHRKLQIDTRLKLLAKWNPKKWGEKVENTHKGNVSFVASSQDEAI